jgi:hypothetical protein
VVSLISAEAIPHKPIICLWRSRRDPAAEGSRRAGDRNGATIEEFVTRHSALLRVTGMIIEEPVQSLPQEREITPAITSEPPTRISTSISVSRNSIVTHSRRARANPS